MDRSLAVRRVAPVAVFAAVLGGIVLVNGSSTTQRGPRPLPIQAAGGVGEDSATRAGAPAMGMPAYGSEVRIPDRLLQGIPTEGPAYALSADESRIEALARALGVDGEPRKQDGTTTVGTGGRVLQVMPYAGQPWHLGSEKPVREPGSGTGTAEPVTDPAPPATAKPEEPTSSTGSTPGDEPETITTPCPPPPPGAEPACGTDPMPMPPPLPPQPSDATARAAMDRVLAALGQQDAAVTMVPGYMGKEVTAAPVVSGLPTSGYETRVTVKADGTIAFANGFLARLRLDATYPLLDPRKAVERGGIGYARDLPAGRPVPDGPATANDMPAVAPATAPASSGPGDSIEPAPAIATAPPTPVPGETRGTEQPKDQPTAHPEPTPVVREAKTLRLGLMFVPSYENAGDAFLVPAWLLGFEGSTWEEPYLALPDEYLKTPPAPSGDPDRPVCDPSPCPDAPPPPDGSTSGGGSSGYDPGAPEPSAS